MNHLKRIFQHVNLKEEGLPEELFPTGVSRLKPVAIICNSDNWSNITSSSPAFLEIIAGHLSYHYSTLRKNSDL
ncbi:hypothetical protein DO021_20410 [Desulfobacter hydrogenophilus]|uniref:Uncharacterized protein n=1 Tax=Desulfobacter hydrogenophilus TaxID=2291 RepID=A0A328F9V1_9BACT|nr:hypothetical protein DO021_20410 [Desulfobacter hydrogenophilus]